MKRLLLSFFVLSVAQSVIAQILDDTTQLVYGPHSTRFFHESDIKYNTGKDYGMDTTLSRIHLSNWADRNDKLYQSLGNLGTALNPTFYQFPEIVGLRHGYDAYNPYLPGADDIRYYDTKSPFIDLNLIFGSQGRSMGIFEFSRNIKPNWNVGFNFRKIVGDKQIGAQQLRGDRNVDNIYYDFYMSYASENGKYHALGYISRFDHKVRETGGIRVFSDVRSDLFRYRDAVIRLRNATAKDFRVNYHIYHQYKLTEFSQLYHSFKRSSQKITYNDFTIDSDTTNYYTTPLIDPDSTMELSSFIYMENEVGLKGQLGPLFYSGYLKRRDIDHFYRYLKPFDKTSETYIGFNARFDFTETIKLGGDGEFLQDGNFKANAFIDTPYLEGGYHAARYEPTILQKEFLGNHREWDNSFGSTFSFELYGNLKYAYKFIRIKPGVSFTTIDNYIYFNQDVVPEQTNRPANISTLKLDLELDLPKHFHFTSSSRVTSVGGDAANVFRIPEFFSTGGLYYDNFWFNDYMQVRIGIDLYYRTAHFANAYDPLSQQFFLQDDFELKSYLMADAYLSAKVNNMMIFLKMNHINQVSGDGYFITPYYPGLQRLFDIGFKWRFFD